MFLHTRAYKASTIGWMHHKTCVLLEGVRVGRLGIVFSWKKFCMEMSKKPKSAKPPNLSLEEENLKNVLKKISLKL